MAVDKDGVMVVVSDVLIEASPVGTVVRAPGESEMVILYLDGNQDAEGGAGQALDLAGHLAIGTGARVVCADYRATFPAALQDARTAYRYCQGHGPVVVTGQRMGAGLAAALLVQLRDSGAALPRCAVLVSGLLDLTMDTKSLKFNGRADPTFDVTALRQRVADYAGGAALNDSLLSPIYANLHGLMPIQLLAAGTDPLLDDSLTFAYRAARSRVAVDLQVWPDMAGLQADTLPTMTRFIQASVPAPAPRTSVSLISG